MHRSVWDAQGSRIDMRLVSRRRQVVQVAGEAIVTEHCYKHPPELLAQMLRDAG